MAGSPAYMRAISSSSAKKGTGNTNNTTITTPSRSHMQLRSQTNQAKAGSTVLDFAREHNSNTANKTKITTTGKRGPVDISQRARMVQRWMEQPGESSQMTREFFENRHQDENGNHHSLKNSVVRLARLAATGDAPQNELKWEPWFEEKTAPQFRSWLKNIVSWIEKVEASEEYNKTASVPTGNLPPVEQVSPPPEAGTTPSVPAAPLVPTMLPPPVSVTPPAPAVPTEATESTVPAGPAALTASQSFAPTTTPGPIPNQAAAASLPPVPATVKVSKIPTPPTASVAPSSDSAVPTKASVTPAVPVKSTALTVAGPGANMGSAEKNDSIPTTTSPSPEAITASVTRGKSPLVLQVSPSPSQPKKYKQHTRLLFELDDGSEHFRYAMMEWKWARRWVHLHLQKTGQLQDDSGSGTSGSPPPRTEMERWYMEWMEQMEQSNANAATPEDVDHNPVPTWVRTDERERARVHGLALPEYDRRVIGGMEGVANGFGPWAKKGGVWCRLLADGAFRPGKGGVFAKKK